MCDPVTLGITSAVIGGAQALMSYSAQNAESKATQKNATQSWRNDQQATTQRELQEQDALRQKQTQSQIEQAEASSEVAVSGAASGISGISLDNLLADVDRRAATNRQTEQTNTDMLMSQLQQQRKGINAQAESRINSAPAASPMSLIAGIGSAGISGFNTYVGAKNKQMGVN